MSCSRPRRTPVAAGGATRRRGGRCRRATALPGTRAPRSAPRPRRGCCGARRWLGVGSSREWIRASGWARISGRGATGPSGACALLWRAGVHPGPACRVLQAGSLVAIVASEPEGVLTMEVREGMSTVILTVGPGHTLREAAAAMAERRVGAAVVKGGFRHLVVIDAGETAGILSVRDIVRCWTDDGATCDVPQSLDLARAS